jgi:integrase
MKQSPAPAQRSNRPKGEGSIYQHTDGRWMYSIMHQGKRLTKSLKTRDYDEALRAYQRIRNQFMGRIDRGELAPTDVNNFTVGQLLTSYLSYMQENGRKSAEMVRLTIGVIQRDRTFLPTRRVSTLTTQDFKEYRRRETARGVAQRTINYRFALIRAALNLETKQTPSRVGTVPYIPFVAENNTREGFLEYDDHTAVLDALPQSLKALFVIAFHSGCRRGELLNMRWSDVDWRNRVIRLPKTKTGKKRNLPFWGAIESHLHQQKVYRDEHHPECEHLFFWMSEDVRINGRGARCVPGTPIKDVRESWSKAVDEAHKANKNVLPELLFHDLRRSGVRVMVQEAGIPESQAMLISGHETRTMLERYNIVSLKNIQDAGAKLDAWSRTRPTPIPTKAPARAAQ